MIKKIGLVVLILAILGTAGTWYAQSASGQQVGFKTVSVERGDLLATISATGTIEPEEVVDIGAQVAGQILSFGGDPRGKGKTIDYGSPVEQGTVLARIDESLYRTQVDRAKAMVDQAEASVESANALVAQAEANVKRSEADVKQMQAKLYQSTVSSSAFAGCVRVARPRTATTTPPRRRTRQTRRR